MRSRDSLPILQADLSQRRDPHAGAVHAAGQVARDHSPPPVERKNLIEDIMRLINVMEAPEHRYCDDLSTLSAPTRRRCRRRAGRTLSDRTMRAPVVEIADILGQDLLQMALIEYEDVVQDSVLTDLTQRSAMAFARGDLNGVRAWAIPTRRTRRSKLVP
jgi:hypothetical protein